MRSLIILTVTFLLYSNAVRGDSDGRVHLDGYNSFITSTESHLFNSNLSVISGFPGDSFYYLPQPQYDSLHHLLHFTASLGAETGDQLLNAYTPNASNENRDHLCTFSSLLKVPRVPLSIAYRYRYIDTYSDRFDALWKQYESVTGSKMKYYNIGLAYDHLGEINYDSKHLQAKIGLNKYSTWSATPYFFSPLFTDGYRVLPNIRYSRNGVSLYTNWTRDNRDDYYNHRTASNRIDVSGRTGIEWAFLKLFTGRIEARYDNMLAPKEALDFHLNRDSEKLNSDVSFTIYSDRNTAFHLNETINFLPKLSLLMSAGNDYVQKGRSYLFFENTVPVKYEATSLHQTNLYGSLTYIDTLKIPFKLSGWIQYCGNPIREYVEPVNDTVFIRQKEDLNSNRGFAGFTGNCNIGIRHFNLRLTPAFAFPLENNRNHFTQNNSLGIDLTYTCSQRFPAVATASVIWKDKSSLGYNFVTDQTNYLQTFNAPSNTSFYLDVKIPFVVPLINSVVDNTFFIFNFGPFRLGGEQRIPEIPNGNLMGPAIYAGIDGAIR